ncbi:MAG: putative thymidylate synthase [Methanoregulaceae archaeon PtaB.Bin056]|jgi:thymidylate synthase|nr:MAG: putative thymidylate synthase [Methanoregulaceae archaeon PtaB.Bin056]
MRIIKAPNLASAHEQVVRMILEKGWVLETEDQEDTIEFEEVAMRVERPDSLPMVSPCSRFQQRFMEKYARDLIEGSDSVFEYDYHDRLFNWGVGLRNEHGEEVHVDQVAYIVQKLRNAPSSRRAIAITWNPAADERLDDCPCLQLVQCVSRDGLLHMKVVFRSNDMLTAAGANMYALVSLQKEIARSLGLDCGSYTHISLVPHIYFRRDADDIEPFCARGERFRPIHTVCRACGKCP